MPQPTASATAARRRASGRTDRTHVWDRPDRRTILGVARATATTPTRSPTSRPRTPTPTRGSPTGRPASRRSSTRSRRRIQETDQSAPVRKGAWWYVTSTEEGLVVPHPLPRRVAPRRRRPSRSCSTRTSRPAGHDFFELGGFDVSPGHTPARVGGRHTGDEDYTLRIRDLDRRRRSRRRDRDTYCGTAWSADGSTSSTSCPTRPMRPFEVWRHRLGTPQSRRRARATRRPTSGSTWASARPQRRMDRHRPASSKLSTEEWLIPAADAGADAAVVVAAPRRRRVPVDHWGDRFVDRSPTTTPRTSVS